MAGLLSARVSLNLFGTGYYQPRARACRVCGLATVMRDCNGAACHAACQEAELAHEPGGGQVGAERLPRGEVA